METNAALNQLSDAAALWMIDPLLVGDVVDAAVRCLVDGLDSEHLRLLAGASSNDSPFIISDLLDRTFAEFGISDRRQDSPSRAVGAMLRRFLGGAMSGKQFTTWAHDYIGHSGDHSCQVFVELDDIFDASFDAAELDRRLRLHAADFLKALESSTRS